MTYVTHWSVAVSVVLIALLACTTGISSFLYDSMCSHNRFVVPVEAVTAIVLVALTSLQLLLTLSTLALVSAYDGSIFTAEQGWRAYGLEWIVQHCLTFFFAAALVGGRFECFVPAMPKWALRLTWFLTPALVLVSWAITLLTSKSSSPYDAFTSLPPLLLGVVAALVPWGVLGFALC